jgi:hypothetical protein
VRRAGSAWSGDNVELTRITASINAELRRPRRLRDVTVYPESLILNVQSRIFREIRGFRRSDRKRLGTFASRPSSKTVLKSPFSAQAQCRIEVSTFAAAKPEEHVKGLIVRTRQEWGRPLGKPLVKR